MRKFITFIFIASVLLLIGSHVEASESYTDLGLAIGQTLNETESYKQTTVIQQFETAAPDTTRDTVMANLSYASIEDFSGKIIEKTNDPSQKQAESILQVETENQQTAYKQDDQDWQQSLTNDSFLGQLQVLSLDQIADLLTLLDATGDWKGSLTDQTLTFQGADEKLTNLLNQVVSDPYNAGANHAVSITVDRQSKTITAIDWQVTGTSRIDNQAITTDLSVKLTSK